MGIRKTMLVLYKGKPSKVIAPRVKRFKPKVYIDARGRLFIKEPTIYKGKRIGYRYSRLKK